MSRSGVMMQQILKKNKLKEKNEHQLKKAVGNLDRNNSGEGFNQEVKLA